MFSLVSRDGLDSGIAVVKQRVSEHHGRHSIGQMRHAHAKSLGGEEINFKRSDGRPSGVSRVWGATSAAMERRRPTKLSQEERRDETRREEAKRRANFEAWVSSTAAQSLHWTLPGKRNKRRAATQKMAWIDRWTDGRGQKKVPRLGIFSLLGAGAKPLRWSRAD